MDFQSANGNGRTFPSYLQIGKCLLLISLVSWLIVNSLNIKTLNNDIKSLKDKIQSHASDIQSHESQKPSKKLLRLVNGQISKKWLSNNGVHVRAEDILSNIRDDFMDYVSDDIYVKVGKYGYFFKFDDRMTFQEGKDRCEQIKGHLVEFDESKPEAQDLLNALCDNFGTSRFWIGLTYDESEESFKWLMGKDYFSKRENAMKLWSKGEPIKKGSDYCVETSWYHEEKMMLRLQSEKFRFKSDVICQRIFSHP